MAHLEDRCQEVVARFAEPLGGRAGVVELVDDFIAPVSATAIGRILGVPAKADDEIRFRKLARSLLPNGVRRRWCPYPPTRCIGANIARLELRLMLDALLHVLPPSACLLEERIQWSARGVMSQIKSLPMDFGG